MSEIVVHAAAGILTLTIDRPDRKNALTQDMYGVMAAALESAATDDAVRVLVIQGSATLFTAGSDIGRFAEGQAAELPDPKSLQSFRFLCALASFPKPVVAAVCGLAVGLGATMLLHCEYVVAGDNASFLAPFVNMGLCPEAGSSLLAPQRLGYRHAVELLMMGEPLTAERACAMGLVNRVVPHVDAQAIGQSVARRLAAKPLSSLVETKRLLKSGQSAAVVARILEEGELFWQMMGRPAAREAIAALTEKRKPDFSRT